MRKTPKLAFVADGTAAARTALRQCAAAYGQVKPAQADAIVVLGGDGFMLATLHRAMNAKPVYGMNLGTVGFLMNEFAADDLPRRVRQAKRVRLNPLRMTARTSVGRRATALAFNEVSLLRATSQMAKLRVVVDDTVRLEALYCDGILTATAAGTTAYNLSAQGPILPVASRLLALTPISAFRPRRWRGAILPGTARLRFEVLEARKRPVNATADNRDVRGVVEVQVEQAADRHVDVLFDADRNLEERILREQFQT